MGDVIYAHFGRRALITRKEWLAGARRCERRALAEPDEIARTLRKCAENYRKQAGEAGL